MTARDMASRPLSFTSQLIARPASEPSAAATHSTLGWRAMEGSITIGIIFVVVFSVADSIAAANWVDSMPDLKLMALLAVASAVLLSSARLHWTAALLLGLGIGTAVVLWQVLTVDSVAGQPFFFDRFQDLWFRLLDWFTQAFNAGITTDNLPFILFVSSAVWLATFPGTLLVLRGRNPWPLLILLGIILSINVSYLDGKQWDFNFAFYIGGAALLLMRTNLLRRMERWRRTGTSYPEFISLTFLAVTIVAVAALMLVARVTPRPDRSAALNDLWGGITAPFDDLSDEFERLFSGIDSRRGAPIHTFSENFVLQGDITPGDSIVVRVDSPEPGLLRGASYDEYTTSGWRQSETVSRSVQGDTPISPDSGAGVDAYQKRREVDVRLSVERSPGVLFSFGAPESVDRNVTVEQLAPSSLRLDVSGDGNRAPTPELAEASAAIAELGDDDGLTLSDLQEAATLLPDEFKISATFTAVPDPEGVARGPEPIVELEIESEPTQADVVSIRASEKVRAGFTYQATGTVSTATVLQLRDAGADYPFWVTDRFLQLPSGLSDSDLARLRELALRVTAGAPSAFDAAASLELYFREGVATDGAGQLVLTEDGTPRLLYPFRTDIELPPPGADAVSWWLFEYVDEAGLPIGGYYDYYASALAVLLRSIDVPARVNTGYALTDNNFDNRTRTFIVRGRDAYTWVEVFFPGYGWVDFDPTPADTGEGFLGIQGQRLASQRFTPFSSDVFDDAGLDAFLDELSFFADIEALQDLDLGTGSESGGIGFNIWFLLGPGVAIAALLVVSGSSRLVWEFSLRGLTPVERAWHSTQRLSRWCGLHAQPTDTPSEYASTLGDAVFDQESARTLAGHYERERFGSKTLSEPQITEVHTAWRSLRGRLMRRILHLKLRPPVDDPDVLGAGASDSAGDDGSA